MYDADLVSPQFLLEFLEMDLESKRRAIMDQFIARGQAELLRDPGGVFPKLLGWSKSRSSQAAHASRAEIEKDFGLLTPGEPVSIARWPNGATCRIGDSIQICSFDRVYRTVLWGEQFRVAGLRRTGSGKYDIYSQDQPGMGVAGVTYLGRKKGGPLFVTGDPADTKFLERPDANSILNPPPPTRAEWLKFKRRIGMDLPETLFTAFAKPDAAICGEPLRFPDFSGLKQMHPVRSHRFLPICRIEPCGDMLCLYIPQEDVAPFVVIHRLELGHVLPIAENAEAFFKAPEKWRRRMDLYGEKERKLPFPPQMNTRPWLDLMFDASGRLGELEFLKDLAFSQEESTEVKFFARAHSRFGSSSDPVRSAIRKAFPRPEAALDPGRWLKLSNSLASSGHRLEAMRALENFVTVIVPQALDDGWARVADAYERMLPLARKAGRAYDIAVIPILIQIANK